MHYGQADTPAGIARRSAFMYELKGSITGREGGFKTV